MFSGNGDIHGYNPSFSYTTQKKASDSFELKESDMHENSYSIKESADYFGWLEGTVNLPLFGCGIRFHVKGDDPIYALRCAEYFEGITADNLKEHTALHTCLEALVGYVADMLDEHGGEFDIEDLFFDEYSSVGDLLKIIVPASLTFERSAYVPEEDCPIAFSLKFSFAPVPDETMEIALHGDVPVYAGEFSGVNPWNDNLLRKKYNYLSKR